MKMEHDIQAYSNGKNVWLKIDTGLRIDGKDGEAWVFSYGRVETHEADAKVMVDFLRRRLAKIRADDYHKGYWEGVTRGRADLFAEQAAERRAKAKRGKKKGAK